MGPQNTDRKQELTEEAKRTAAYALNLCMVSVSQIIDYDDVYILEQEYDSILNNLNLEEMPKDAALLDILKQLLNVITFFRIQEGDRAFLEREYRQRVKDAIWSAVPRLSVVVTSGDWRMMAASLATQVGIGYMNYRREKSRARLEQDRERWKLQRAAMEQFNGLRRELFDTAWRLAEAYRFPDAYRITERQITRYNRILMDSDPLRRYERLSSVADRFEAYPPFLYFWGSAANMVSRDERYDPEVRARYRALACGHFKTFLDRTEHNLLREDHLLASGALEYFDLLTLTPGSAPEEFLEGLLSRAIEASGSAFDVLQLCAASYLKIGRTEKAAALLRVLVNEDYNAGVNAQLLSALYVSRCLRYGDREARADYQTLSTRVPADLLFPLPASPQAGGEVLQAGFTAMQKKLLAGKYGLVMTGLLEQYSTRFNRIIPPADAGREYPEHYFDSAGETRKQDILNLFDDSRARREYLLRLSGAHMETRMIDVLNDMYAAVCRLPCMEERPARERFYSLVVEQTQAQRSKLDHLLSRLYGGMDAEFDRDDCRRLLDLSLTSFTGKAFDDLYGTIVASVKGMTTMGEIACTESRLQRFCADHGLPDPVVRFAVGEEGGAICAVPRTFDMRLLGRRALQLKQEQDLAQRMAECVRTRCRAVLPGEKNPFRLLVRGDGKLADQIERDRALRELGQDRIVALLDDTGLGDQDLVFTTGGVCPYFRVLFMKTLLEPVPYESAELFRRPVLTLKLGESKFFEKQVDIAQLYALMQDLAALQRESRQAGRRQAALEEGRT